MKQDDISGILRCPKDGGTLRTRSESIRCASCGSSWRSAEGRVYFVEPPQDFVPGGEIGAENRAEWSRWRLENLRFLERSLAERRREDVLIDIGIGVAPFRDAESKFECVIGVDFFPYPNVHVVADITRPLPFQDGTCDIVLMLNVLEHVPTPQPLLRECFRLLRPGGVLLGTVPFLREVHMEPYDFGRYTYIMLERMLGEAGFTAYSVESLGNPFDVFETIQRQFFDRLIHTRAHQLSLRQSAFHLTARLGRKLFTTAASLFRPIFERVASSTQHTEGYGFAAGR